MTETSPAKAIVPAALLMLLFLLNTGSLMGAAVIPKFGFSISPDGEVAEIARVTTACGLTDAVVILPAAYINLDNIDGSGGTFEIQEKIINSISEGPQFYVRVRIAGGRIAQTGRDQEAVITTRVADAINRLPLNNAAVQGLMVEVEGPLPTPELLNFVLSDIAIKVKAKKDKLELVLSLPPGFIEENGSLVKRLASYYDALGIPNTTAWRDHLAWIAEQALNKPVFVKLASDPSSDPEKSASSFLDTTLAIAGTSVTVLWVDQPAAASLGRLCDVKNFLSRFLPSDVVTVGPGLSPFSVTVDGAPTTESTVFTLPRTKNSGIMVKLNAAGRENTARLHGPSSGQFEIQWYNALTGRLLKPEEMNKDTTGLTQACVSEPGFIFILIRDVEPSQKQLYSEIVVTARPDLTVEEVIARWQQYKESQGRSWITILRDASWDCISSPPALARGLMFRCAFNSSGIEKA